MCVCVCVYRADGVNSIARQYLVSSKITPWKCTFRVLLTPEGIDIPHLDDQTHYIFSGKYTFD